jgi:hypothetical protein
MTASDTKGNATGEGQAGGSRRSEFEGPLFIVGMPRSGTKLLRDLLRGHPLIRIPPTESNLLTAWARDWERFGDLSDRRGFSAFYEAAVRSPYFLLMEKHTGGPLPEDVWYASCRSFGPGDLFEALIRHDVDAPVGSGLIWGDKSPPYTEHIDLIGGIFAGARFIHVVRDVRDYCLSLRNTWGKNMVRGAQRWADGVVKARKDGTALSDRYLEVRYEDLLADPERELRRCCEFLGIDYDSSLTELRFSTEHLGSAKGAGEIVGTNVRKFEHMLEPRMRRRIESVAGAALREFGYDVEEPRNRRVPRALMAWYRLLDGMSFVRAQSRRSGFARTAQLQLGGRVRSGWHRALRAARGTGRRG